MATITGTSGDDPLSSSGNDTFFEYGGNDTFLPGDAQDVVYGSTGYDTVDYSDSSWALTVSLLTGTTTGAGNDDLYGIEAVVGSDYADLIYGDSQANFHTGGTGNDTLNGMNSDDLLYGDTGNDKLDGSDDDDTLYGSDGADTIYGGDDLDTLDGGSGADLMYGGAGDDIFIVDEAGDTVIESASQGTDRVNSAISYTLGSNVEDLILTGTSAINRTGNSLYNTIQGNSGVNTLYGGDGDDADTVSDFTAGSATDDGIDLSGIASATVFQDVLDAATDDGTDTAIDFGSGDTITLLGVVESELHSDDFSFA